jgi:capsid protein
VSQVIIGGARDNLAELIAAEHAATAPTEHPVAVSVNELAQYVGGVSESWTGDKFAGGFGVTKDYDVVDYWTLRLRSKQLFTENLYARGLIRRLITNEINKGLALEATPDADILGIDPEDLAAWSENTERRFAIWGKTPELCDYKQAKTFGAVQREARLMALVSGDVLVIVRQGLANLPMVELVDAEHVADPASDTMIRAVSARGHTLSHGVEMDAAGRHVAFFVTQSDGTSRRVTSYGRKTGRRQAWLLYGTERLIDEVRGQSLLALVIQSLKEVDRYRDAEQRAAVINSMVALWIKKGEDKMGTSPLTAGAIRKDTVTTQNDSQGRKDVQFSQHMPGMMFQELQTGEEPVSYDTRRPNVNFGVFEAAIINGIAWANEMPPEVLTLAFQNNYSASRGAVNEFKIYLEKARNAFGEEFASPIYQDYLLSEVLADGINADGLLEAWVDGSKWDILGAWMLADWSGAIKPNVDLLKEVRAYAEMMGQGLITRERATRELTGMKFSKVSQQLARENEALAAAIQPLIDAGIVKDENPEDIDTLDEED